MPASDGARIAWLHAHGEVLDEGEAGEGRSGPVAAPRRAPDRQGIRPLRGAGCLTPPERPDVRRCCWASKRVTRRSSTFRSLSRPRSTLIYSLASRAREARTSATCSGRPAAWVRRSNTAISSRRVPMGTRANRRSSSTGCGAPRCAGAPRPTASSALRVSRFSSKPCTTVTRRCSPMSCARSSPSPERARVVWLHRRDRTAHAISYAPRNPVGHLARRTGARGRAGTRLLADRGRAGEQIDRSSGNGVAGDARRPQDCPARTVVRRCPRRSGRRRSMRSPVFSG